MGEGLWQHPLGAQPGLQCSVFTVHISGHHIERLVLVPFCRWRKSHMQLATELGRNFESPTGELSKISWEQWFLVSPSTKGSLTFPIHRQLCIS